MGLLDDIGSFFENDRQKQAKLDYALSQLKLRGLLDSQSAQSKVLGGYDPNAKDPTANYAPIMAPTGFTPAPSVRQTPEGTNNLSDMVFNRPQQNYQYAEPLLGKERDESSGFSPDMAIGLMNGGPDAMAKVRGGLLGQAAPEYGMQMAQREQFLGQIPENERLPFMLDQKEYAKRKTDQAIPLPSPDIQAITQAQSMVDKLGRDNPAAKPFLDFISEKSGAIRAAQNDETARHNRATEATSQWDVTKDAMGNPLRINKITGEVVRPDGGAVPEQDAIDAQAKMIANYNMAPPSGIAMLKPFGQLLMKRVAELNPDYDAKSYNSAKQAKANFAAGKNGTLVRQANTSASHLLTLEALGDALDNGDVTAINQLKNTLSSQLGGVPISGYEAAAKVVGDEINKFISGGPGAADDRAAYAKTLSAAKGPEARRAAINALKGLMVGQLHSLNRQYTTETKSKDFADKLEPEVADLLSNPQFAVGSNPTVPAKQAPGGTPKLTKDAAGKAAYDALPVGAVYIDPNGQFRTKGAGQ